MYRKFYASVSTMHKNALKTSPKNTLDGAASVFCLAKILILLMKIFSKRIWSAYFGQATSHCALTGAIPLLPDAIPFGCSMSRLARFGIP